MEKQHTPETVQHRNNKVGSELQKKMQHLIYSIVSLNITLFM